MWKKSWVRLAVFAVVAAFPLVGSAQQQVYPILCESGDYETVNCSVGAPVVSATIFAQRSRTQCVIGGNVQVTQTGIQVSGGCRAYFFVTALTDRPAYTVTCTNGSETRPNTCVAPDARAQNRNIHEVWLGNLTYKGAACTQGFSYKAVGDTVVVAPGCSAVLNYSLE